MTDHLDVAWELAAVAARELAGFDEQGTLWVLEHRGATPDVLRGLDGATGKERRRLVARPRETLEDAAVSPDGTALFLRVGGRRPRIDVRDAQGALTAELEAPAGELVPSRSGRHLAIWGPTLHVVDVASGTVLCEGDGVDVLTTPAWLPDEATLVIAVGPSSAATISDAARQSVERLGDLQAIALALICATRTAPPELVLVAADGGRERLRIPLPAEAPDGRVSIALQVRTVAVSRDGACIAVAGNREVWHADPGARTCRRVRTLDLEPEAPDAVSRALERVRAWGSAPMDHAGESELRGRLALGVFVASSHAGRYGSGQEDVTYAAEEPGGRFTAGLCSDGRLRLWAGTGGAPRAVAAAWPRGQPDRLPREGRPSPLALSPCGRRVVVRDAASTLRCFALPPI